ncbi:MAG TPA: hypothetical protein VFJ18_10855 [Pararhizobium sp.]|nr:hypothetical protein [Pararhizobium sp.]
MTRTAALLLTALVPAVFAPPAALAFVPNLNQKQAEKAIERGKQEAASKEHGFIVKNHVLYASKDPLTIAEGGGEVDAVIVGTPTLMLTYHSYLEAFQKHKFDSKIAAPLIHSLNDSIRFIVYAHAPSAKTEDQDFLSKFHDFEFKTAAGKTLTPAGMKVFGPGKDYFSVAGQGREFRWLGTDTVAFSLAGLKGASASDLSSLKGTLSFKDSTGRAYSFDVDLGQYE